VRRLLPATFLWAPVVVLYVLVGFAVGWWVPVIFAVVSAVIVGWAVVYRRRLRRLRTDPDAMRAHDEWAYRRSVRRVKIWGLSLTGMMMFLMVLALVVLIAQRA
jgi:ABC-type protease/lipase transport system fused ATPase/permease subunit